MKTTQEQRLEMFDQIKAEVQKDRSHIKYGNINRSDLELYLFLENHRMNTEILERLEKLEKQTKKPKPEDK